MALTLNDLLTVLGVSVVVTILVQVTKRWLTEDRVPPFALALGILLAVTAALTLGLRTAPELGNAVLTGFLGGAAAIGLYEAAPRRLLPPKPDEPPHG